MKEIKSLKEGAEYFFELALKYEKEGKDIDAYNCLNEAISWEFFDKCLPAQKKEGETK